MVSAGSIRLGITGRNLREPEFEGPEGPAVMMRQVRAGVALAPRSLASGVHGPFSLAFDADLTTTPAASGDIRLAVLGGEFWIAHGRVGARTGVRWNTLNASQRAISGGATLRLPRSIFVEGQLTKSNGDGEAEWQAGARITF